MNTQNTAIRHTWVSYPDSAPTIGQLVEILVDINPVQSWSYQVIAEFDPVTRQPRWLNPVSSKPISGFRRVTHWRKV